MTDEERYTSERQPGWREEAGHSSGSLQPDCSAAGVEWPEVIFQKWPSTTGAQQCCKCGGWIMGAQSYWSNNTGPMCPSCYKQQNK